MAEFKIDGRMKVKTLKENFKEEFGGTLHIYKNGKELADNDATLASIRQNEDAKGGSLLCRASRTVGKFEQELWDVFGIKVNVFTPDDWVAVLDGITLNTIKNIPDKSTKEKMKEFLAYQRNTESVNGNSDVKSEKISIDFKLSSYPIFDFVFEKIDWELNEDSIEEKREEIDLPGVVYVKAVNEDGDSETNVFSGDIADCLYDALETVNEKSEEYPIVDVYYTSKCEVYGTTEEDLPFYELAHVIASFLGSDDWFDYDFDTPVICKYKDPYEENMWVTDDSGDWGDEEQIDKSVIDLLIEYHTNPNEVANKIDWIYPTMEWINEKGEIVFKCNCEMATSFKNGCSFIQLNDKWSLINRNGEQIISRQFDRINKFSDNGLASVRIDGKYGYINTKGEIVIPYQFDSANNFTDNGLARIEINDKFGFINAEGEIVIPCKFDSAEDFTVNGLAKVDIDYEYGFINTKGEIVIPCQFDSVYNFQDNGLAAVRIDGKYGFINTKGEIVIPCQFDRVNNFSDNGLARIEIDDKYGYINEKGEIVISCQFNYASDFKGNGLASVRIDDKYGYINEKGEIVISCQFDRAVDFSGNGLAAVQIDDKYGYINEKGEIVIPCQFDSAYNFRDNGLAKVRIDGKYGFVNEKGKFVVPCKFNNVDDFSEGLAWVK